MILQNHKTHKYNRIGRKVISIICIPCLGFMLYFFYLKYNIGIPCLFHKITGWYCPGCGLTRAIVSLLQFDFYQAFRYNSFGIILLPFLLVYVQYQLICWGFQWKDKLTPHIPKAVTYGLLILVLLYGVLRNLDLFSYLAPTNI